jgi:hypothetical protein
VEFRQGAVTEVDVQVREIRSSAPSEANWKEARAMLAIALADAMKAAILGEDERLLRFAADASKRLASLGRR